MTGTLAKKRLGESSELEKALEFRGGRGCGEADLLEDSRGIEFAQQFRERKGMQSVIMITSLQGIPAPADDIQSGAAGDEELVFVLQLVEFAFDQAFPAAELVDFV
jgi:hypothetical protein